MADYPVLDSTGAVLVSDPTPLGKALPTPVIQQGADSEGVWEEDTLRFRVLAGTSTVYPRLTFDFGFETGETYDIDIQLAGYTASTLLARVGTAGTDYLDWNPETQRVTGQKVATGSELQMFVRGTERPDFYVKDIRWTKIS